MPTARPTSYLLKYFNILCQIRHFLYDGNTKLYGHRSSEVNIELAKLNGQMTWSAETFNSTYDFSARLVLPVRSISASLGIASFFFYRYSRYQYLTFFVSCLKLDGRQTIPLFITQCNCVFPHDGVINFSSHLPHLILDSYTTF